MKTPKLSVVIITLNEEKNIRRCLDSIKEIADEMVVVDSGSTDKTLEIARSYKAKIFFRKFDTFDQQKNWATSKATGNWIFALDADEEATKELGVEIKRAIKNTDYEGYLIPRRNIIFKKEIKHTRWSPDEHIWLWKKDKGFWSKGVHSEIFVKGKVGRLKSGKIHYQYETVAEFFSMMNKYSEAESQEKIEAGHKFTYNRLLFDPLYNFLVRYVYRLGFLDGWRGFVLSYLMAVYHLNIWIKVWERQQR